MRKMKDSGIEWIGDIPEEWEVRKLNSIALKITDFVASGSFASLRENVKYLDEPDYAMLVRTVDLSKNSTTKKVYIDNHSYHFLSNSNLFGGELILSNIGSVGNVFLYQKLYIRASLAPNSIMINMDGENRFYYYWLLSPIVNKKLQNLGSDAVQKKFNKTQLRSFLAPHPSKKVQKQIADYLDKKCSLIDNIIEKQKTLIEKLKSYKQSLITEAVTKGLDPNVKMKPSGIEWVGDIPEGWVIRKITTIFSEIGSGTTPNTYFEDNYEGSINWVLTGDLNDGELIETAKHISEKALSAYSTLKVYDVGSLVIAMYGATIGKISKLKIKAATNQACCVLSEPKDAINQYYFYILLASKDGIISIAKGSGQPNISQSIIKNLRLPLPSQLEQKQIAEYLDKKCDQINKTIETKQKLIDRLAEYKKSLIYECVTGKKEIKADA